MTDLIAVVGVGKGTWTQVAALMNAEKWENVYLVTNDFGKEKFNSGNAKLIVLDENMSIEDMKNKIVSELKDKLKMEAAVNMVSGGGKEHMALLAALVSLGVGLRLVIENNGIKEI